MLLKKPSFFEGFFSIQYFWCFLRFNKANTLIMKSLYVLFLLMPFALMSQEQLISAVETVEQKEPCLQRITGQIRDHATNEPIPNSIVSLLDENGAPVQTVMATSDASFSFQVSCMNTYKLTASKDSYNTQEKTFTTSDDSGLELSTKIFLDQGRIDFVVDPAKQTKSSETAKISANSDVSSAALNPILPNFDTQKRTDNNEKPTEAPIESAEIKPEETIETPEQPKIELESNLEEVTEEPVAVKTVKNKFNEDILVLKPVLFDYESSYLNQQAKKDLLKVVNVLKNNPKLVLECASYTDAKGSEKYNQWMSERRAKRTVEYIIRKGIHPTRIKGKGYGESKLINDCTEGENCTDQQRAVNRRTEFKVVKN